jgi:DNA-binding transcriptional LysR family regulator
MQEWLYADEGSLLRVDTCNSMSIIASLTAAGLGISLLPEQFYQNAIQDGRLKPIMTKPDIPLVEFSAVYPRVPPNTAQRCLSELAVQMSTFEALASRGQASDASPSGTALSSDMNDTRP